MNDFKADVFCLLDSDGKLLSPSVQATVLAKYSRSPLPAREILRSLTEEEADKFQDKWVIGYSHSSVADLAALPVCYEGVSMIASKFLESFQRMGYSEKSTRYQIFNRDSFITPPGAPDTMKNFASRFYDAYERLYPKVVRRCAELMGRDMSDPKSFEDRLVKARAFDNVRYLLPAGTGTSLGAEGFLRDHRYMIQAARGHSNSEIQAIGNAAHAAISVICPVLVQKSDPDTFEPQIVSLGSVHETFNPNDPNWYAEVHKPHLLQNKDLLQKSFESSVANLYGMSWTAFSKHMEGRGKRHTPRVFRTQRITFDLMMDYGAYRDLQRHRRCEQFAEPLTANYGYIVPDDILGSDLESDYRQTMESIHLYDDEDVVHNSDLMQYMIPMGYLHRSIFDMDLQELYYIIEMRTQKQGHQAYRRVAWRMLEAAREHFPGQLQWVQATDPINQGEHH